MFKYFYLFSKICQDINKLYKMFVNIFKTATKNHCPVKSVSYKNKKMGIYGGMRKLKKQLNYGIHFV